MKINCITINGKEFNPIDILMEDHCTRSDAERHLRIGVEIFPAEDFEKHLESYISEWDADCDGLGDELREMVAGGKAAGDWSVVTIDDEKFYIEYFS